MTLCKNDVTVKPLKILRVLNVQQQQQTTTDDC